MSMIIQHNINAINANRNLGVSQNNLSSSLSKLSSGYRINKGADGPADLVISEQLRSQINGLERAVRNTNEAINVLSIAEGALNEMNSILKKMKALAIHAASDGVTSPEQVEADQAEMDSAIQTLQRISDTTKYSDQSLLNGAKDITYSISTDIKGTQNNQLVNQNLTQYNQIYKRDGYAVNYSFTGAVSADKTTLIGDADMTKQAQKAYLEIDTVAGSLSQIDDEGNLTQAQSFILTGALGSRRFSFASGTSVTDIVSAISSYSGSTGIDAALTFNSSQTINQCGDISSSCAAASQNANGTWSDARNVDDVTIFENYYVDEDGNRQVIIDTIDTITGTGTYGLNTDGQGRIFIKVTGNNTFELYKDESMSAASLIGVGDAAGNITEVNNSDIASLGLSITLAGTARYGDVAYISLGNICLETACNVQADGIMNADETGAGGFSMACSVASGVQLGVNTDASGKIYTKVVVDDQGIGTVYAYSDASMSSEYLVAMSAENIDLNGSGAVILNAIWNDDKTASTGLGMHLNIVNGGFAEGTSTGEIQFLNLGARISSTEYGSDAFIQIQQQEGGLFTYYDQQDNASTATLVDNSMGVYRQYGQDATINVNGQQMKTNGLRLNVATTDIQAKVVFNEGKAGTTTIAQVGYTEGSIFTKNTALTFAQWDTANYGGVNAGFSALLNNACHNTRETTDKFTGGMQLQLGESAGDQDRTIVAMKSMAVSNLGKIEVTMKFDPSSAVIETKTLSLLDVQSSNIASLDRDPVLAMKIIEQAITDVANMRAHIGALQSNLLQTNANNLEVAIENITNTEAAIRDTDMATEMTSYTSAQVLQNAGISMLAQANAQAQSVLSLLQ